MIKVSWIDPGQNGWFQGPFLVHLQLVTSAGWKLGAIVRTRRLYADADLFVLHEAHLLSYAEYRTPAILSRHTGGS